MITRLLVAVCLSVSVCGYGQISKSLIHDDMQRNWIEYVPNNYNATESYPLVLVLHGAGGHPRQLMTNTRKQFNKLADDHGFIVVYPEGLKKSWNDNNTRDQNGYARKENIDDVGFIKKLVERLKVDHSIDSSAVFVCGISNGGLMSQTLAMEVPNTFKAIGMVAANFGKDEIEENTSVQPFSVMFIHGTDDALFPYDEGEIGLRKPYRGRVLGIEKSIDYILNLNGNSQSPERTTIPDKTDDCCTSEHLKYSNTENPALKVELIKVNNGGHTWPGAKEQRLIKKLVGETTQDFNACDMLWAFFKSHLD